MRAKAESYPELLVVWFPKWHDLRSRPYLNWNDKFATIFEAGHECFLQVAPVLFYKMDAKNTAVKNR
jgi:hypothetical protein